MRLALEKIYTEWECGLKKMFREKRRSARRTCSYCAKVWPLSAPVLSVCVCLSTRYCDVSCQRQHWLNAHHKNCAATDPKQIASHQILLRRYEPEPEPLHITLCDHLGNAPLPASPEAAAAR